MIGEDGLLEPEEPVSLPFVLVAAGAVVIGACLLSTWLLRKLICGCGGLHGMEDDPKEYWVY